MTGGPKRAVKGYNPGRVLQYLGLALLIMTASRGTCAENDLLWLRTYDSSTHSHDAALGISADWEGCAYVAGYETRTDRAEGENALVRRYGPDGAVLWSDSYNSGLDMDDRALAVVILAGGGACAAGYCLGSTYFSSGWLRRYASDGTAEWTANYGVGGDGMVQFEGIAVDSVTGGIYAAGRVRQAGASQWDALLTRFTQNGTIVWARTLDGALGGDDRFSGVAVDSLGHVLVTGAVAQKKNGPEIDYDAIIAGYYSDGNLKWTKTYGSDAPSEYHDDGGAAISADGAGNFYIAGFLNAREASDYDWWIRKYAAAGPVMLWEVWERDSSQNQDTTGKALACEIGPGRSLHVAGWRFDNSFPYRAKDLRFQKIDSRDGHVLHSAGYDSEAWTGGGQADDIGYGISIAPDGAYFVAGAELREDLGQGWNWVVLKYAAAAERPASAENIIAYPNPFDPREAVGGRLKFISLPTGARISIYTSGGRLVKELAESGNAAAWDGRNSSGRMVATGAYFYVVEIPDGAAVRGKLAVVNR